MQIHNLYTRQNFIFYFKKSFNPFITKFIYLFIYLSILSFGYAKLCFEFSVLKIEIKFDLYTGVPVEVKGLNASQCHHT